MNTADKLMIKELNTRGFRFPAAFVAMDAETTAEGQYGRLPVQLALVEVEDGKVKDTFEIFLNWGVGTDIPPQAFHSELNKINFIMAAKGDTFPITYDMICQRGVPAIAGLKQFIGKLLQYINARTPIIGHNIHGFDARMLDAITERYLMGWLAPWKETLVLDTGLFEKALNDDLFCYTGEPLDSWQRRVANVRSSTKWNLKGCITKYGLQEKMAGQPAHNAVADSMAVIHLTDVFNQILAGTYSG
jgi:hypothetical protein